MLPSWEIYRKYISEIRTVKLEGNNEKCYKARYKRVYTYFASHSFTFIDCKVYISELIGEKLSSAYTNNIIKMIRSLCDYFELYGGLEIKEIAKIRNIQYIQERPFHNVEVLTEKEIKKLAEFKYPYKLTPRKRNHRMKTIIYTLSLGLRVGELINLTWDDVKEEYIYIRKGKTVNSERDIELPKKVYKLIMKLPRVSQYVFGSKIGQLDPDFVTYDLKNRAKVLGINKRITPHIFRHSLITSSIEKGVPIPFIAAHVGHVNWKTTQRYTHLTRNHSKKVVDASTLYRNNKTEQIQKAINNKINDTFDKNKLQAIYSLLSS